MNEMLAFQYSLTNIFFSNFTLKFTRYMIVKKNIRLSKQKSNIRSIQHATPSQICKSCYMCTNFVTFNSYTKKQKCETRIS